MRILIISDSHRRPYTVERIIRAHPECKEIYFLGDILSDIEKQEEHFPDRIFHKVSGNCDFGSLLPSSAVEQSGGINVFYTHGHTLGVKYGTDRLLAAAGERGCKLALFGHTHIPLCEYRGGIYIVNPGSCSSSRSGPETYAVADIGTGGILPAVLRVDKL